MVGRQSIKRKSRVRLTEIKDRLCWPAAEAGTFTWRKTCKGTSMLVKGEENRKHRMLAADVWNDAAFVLVFLIEVHGMIILSCEDR